MSLRFRNLDVTPDAPVASWPTEGVLAAVERGSLGDWQRLMTAIRDDPWGSVARRLEEALAVSQPYGTAALLHRGLAQARAAAEAEERTEIVRRVRALVAESGLTQAAFAEAIGTSGSRLSTYLSGKVAPSSPLLVRMERVARTHGGSRLG